MRRSEESKSAIIMVMVMITVVVTAVCLWWAAIFHTALYAWLVLATWAGCGVAYVILRVIRAVDRAFPVGGDGGDGGRPTVPRAVARERRE